MNPPANPPNPFSQRNSPRTQYIPGRGRPNTYVLECLLYLFLLYVFYLAADRYADAASFRQPSIVMFVFHWMFLYIHEGGHFLFSFFGRTLHILGGSFWQVMFPFLSFLIALRSADRIAPFPLFLTGFNLLGVSLYMRDAPLRQLALLGGDRSRHDWYNLFMQWEMLDSAETIADITYYLGFVVCLGSILAGFYLAYQAYFNPKIPADAKVQVSLDLAIQKKETGTESPEDHSISRDENPFGS